MSALVFSYQSLATQTATSNSYMGVSAGCSKSFVFCTRPCDDPAPGKIVTMSKSRLRSARTSKGPIRLTATSATISSYTLSHTHTHTRTHTHTCTHTRTHTHTHTDTHTHSASAAQERYAPTHSWLLLQYPSLVLLGLTVHTSTRCKLSVQISEVLLPSLRVYVVESTLRSLSSGQYVWFSTSKKRNQPSQNQHISKKK